MYFLKNCLKGHLRREGRQLTFGQGVPYISPAAWKDFLKGYKPGRKLLGDVENWEELEASQSIIVSSPETVYRRIWKIIEQAKGWQSPGSISYRQYARRACAEEHGSVCREGRAGASRIHTLRRLISKKTTAQWIASACSRLMSRTAAEKA
jgi:hypothetical protein